MTFGKRKLDAIKALYGNGTPPKTTKRRKKRQYPERVEQVALVKMMKLHNVPHFQIKNEGKEQYNAYAMGLWPGACDLMIPRAASGKHGFFIEMKAPGRKPRPNQLEFMRAMRDEGYKAEWYDDWRKAWQAVREYLCI